MGWNRPVMMEYYAALADAYQADGKPADAETNYLQAVRLSQEGLRSNSLIVATVLEKYADLLRKTKREEEAVRLENQAKQIRTSLGEPAAPTAPPTTPAPAPPAPVAPMVPAK